MERSTTKERRAAKRRRQRTTQRARQQLHCALAAVFLVAFFGMIGFVFLTALR
jgi:hypothetical protein